MIQARTVGIIFPNMHDETIPDLIAHRTMASVPFGGRYRMVDFPLSGMTNSGIRSIGVIVRKNYQSLMDHVGNGREWDLSSKRGGLNIFPPYGRDVDEMVPGRLSSLQAAYTYLENRKEPIVVMSDCNIICNIDFTELVEAHLASGADITTMYEKTNLMEDMRRDNTTYTLSDSGQVTEIRLNDYRSGPQNICMNVYVIGREFLIDVLRDAKTRSLSFFEQDLLVKNLKKIKLQGFEYKGYLGRIYDMGSYFKENMRLLDPKNLEALFLNNRPVYTKVRDEAPVRYAIGSSVHNSIIADGCIIEGTVENSVLFRGVHVGKGAVVRNTIIMQGSQVQAGAQIENIITDKDVLIGEGQTLRGAASYPVFISKGRSVL